jgi:hypothetical protein
VNLRRLSNGAVLNRRTPDGSAAMHPTQESPGEALRAAGSDAMACEARTSGSAQHVQVPCNHSCEAILSRWGMGESQGPRFRLNNRTYIETCDLRMPKPH